MRLVRGLKPKRQGLSSDCWESVNQIRFSFWRRSVQHSVNRSTTRLPSAAFRSWNLTYLISFEIDYTSDYPLFRVSFCVFEFEILLPSSKPADQTKPLPLAVMMFCRLDREAGTMRRIREQQSSDGVRYCSEEATRIWARRDRFKCVAVVCRFLLWLTHY